jgi:hypothetical protein
LRLLAALRIIPRMRTQLHCLLAAGALATSTAFAGEAAGTQPPQRPLLQPPVDLVPSPITDRFAVRAIFFQPSVTTSGRYDDAAGTQGTPFSGEDSLNLPDKRSQAWIDLAFRMTPRHRISAQFYELKRNGSTVLTQQLDFGDDSFLPADGTVRSSMDLRQLNVGYLYSLLQKQRIEIGLGFGIHLLQLDATMEAPAAFKRQHLDTAGPYPTLDGDLSWRITRRFSVNGAAHYFNYISTRTDGSSLSWNADLQFRAARNLAVGAGYSSTRYHLSSSDPDFFQGFVKLQYRGPELFLRASF